MPETPFTFDINVDEGIPLNKFSQHLIRRLSVMAGQFLDETIYADLVALQDPIIYEVFEVQRSEEIGELVSGISIVHPGKVGKEYFKTKGHFHNVLETAEVYYCLKGTGFMVLETPEGDTAVAPLHRHKGLYVPPRWAHRSVNTSHEEDLVTFFIYPANAGHDYGSIERNGFRKLILEREGKPVFVDNPKWLPPDRR